jgi:serine/threonine-protein kinase RsbT
MTQIQHFCTYPQSEVVNQADVLLLNWEIVDHFDIQIVISQIKKMLKMSGVDDLVASKLLTTASELTWNMIKYAKGGTLSCYGRMDTQKSAIILTACDQGKGIADLALALKDQYSTGNTLGLGLPSVKRMMDYFEIKTSIKGTFVFVLLWVDVLIDALKQNAQVVEQLALTPIPKVKLGL